MDVDTLLNGREALTLEDVMATLNSKEVKEKSKVKGDDGEGLYVRGRTNRKDPCQSRGKSRSKSRCGRLKCYIFQSDDHLKRNCLKNNRKKSTGYVKKDDQPSFSVYSWVTTGSVRSEVLARTYQRGETIGAGKARDVWQEKSRRVWVYILRFKYKAFGKFKEWKQLVENQSGRTVKKLRTYNGLESPSTAIEKKTPMEMWSGHLSDYGLLRIFGYVTYPHDKQGKLELRVIKCVLLGYPKGVKGYRLYRLDNESAKIVTIRNVVEVELHRLNNHTPKDDKTDQEDGDDEDVGDQETDQKLDLTDYQLARDREPMIRTKPLRFQYKSNMAAYAFVVVEEEDTHEPLTYQEAVTCEDSSK
ncbi:retrotransposon protein, putative, ty1-copia subclass [Tanacetum coccineum]